MELQDFTQGYKSKRKSKLLQTILEEDEKDDSIDFEKIEDRDNIFDQALEVEKAKGKDLGERESVYKEVRNAEAKEERKLVFDYEFINKLKLQADDEICCETHFPNRLG